MSPLDNRPEAGDGAIARKSGADASESLSREFTASDNKLFTENTGEDQKLVNQGVLPKTGFIDFGKTENPDGDSPVAKTENEAEGDSATEGESLNKVEKAEKSESVSAKPSGFDNDSIEDPDTFKNIADAAANLVEANGDSNKQQKILDELATSFNKANPNAPGTTLARYLRTALEVTPGGENLAVNFYAGEGERDGSTDIVLSDRNNPDKELARSNVSFVRESSTSELGAVETDLRTDLPDFVSRLDNPESLGKIVQGAEDIIRAQIQGKDVGELFQNLAAEFKTDNPNAGVMEFTTLLQGAFEHNPHANKALRTGFGGPEAYLLNPLNEKGKRIISTFDIGFGKTNN